MCLYRHKLLRINSNVTILIVIQPKISYSNSNEVEGM